MQIGYFCLLRAHLAYTQTERIDKLLSNPDARLRVVLPDPDDAGVTKTLSVRFDMNPDTVKQEIEEARRFFERKKKRAKGTVEVYFTGLIPLFTFYRFNNKLVLALYNHRAGQQPVPSFVCDKEGFLF